METTPAEAPKSIVSGPVGIRLDSVITPYINELRSYTDNETGLVIGVTNADEILYARAFGYADLERGTPADFNTLFHIASVSKPFAAAAIVKLVEQGKIGLDDPLIKYIPEFEMRDSLYRGITLRHILTHSSGIPRHISSGDWDNPSYDALAMEENITDAREFGLDFMPGTQFSYSNSAFDLLGVVVNRASGMPYDDFVEQHILVPAGMTNSVFHKPADSLPADWAAPYSYGVGSQEWSPYPYTAKYYPSSGLQTTLLDMCQWGMLHLNEGAPVFEPAAFESLITPQFETPWGDHIGLGWFLQSYLERPLVMHTGADTGFECMMYIYPEDGISIVVMANRDFARTGRIVNAVSEAVFGQIPKTYTVSARYPFGETFRDSGIDAAARHWEDLRRDTTDIYSVDNSDILTAGAVLENGRKWEEARQVLEFYLSLNQESTYGWRLLGNTQLNMGDTLQAIKSYKRTLEINPDYTRGREALDALLGPHQFSSSINQ